MLHYRLRRLNMLALYGFIAAPACAATATLTVKQTIQPNHVLNPVDERVYGHFLEHIYRSVNGGLWGELIWNRSFEVLDQSSQWERTGDVLRQVGNPTGLPSLTIGNPRWTDYELALEARRDSGPEGFLITVRYTSPQHYYWANFGGINNTCIALEAGCAGGMRTILQQLAPRPIEQGRWYQVRIRCEGARIQVWLDGEQVLDFTDAENRNPAGAIGLGAWATHASFRNVRVTDLAGHELYAGLPPTPAPRTLDWQAVDADGRRGAVHVTRGALNDDFCVALGGAGTAIEQGHLKIEAGERYAGSLWACGADPLDASASPRPAPAPLRVELRDGEAVLASAQLPAPPPASWAELPFTLRAAADASSATLRITQIGAGAVQIDQVSLMPERWRTAGGFRPDLLEAVADLRPPVIRWPGGCYAEYYRWQDGVGPQHLRGKFPWRMWEDEDVNALGTDEFIQLCRKTGSEPLIVINSGRHKPEIPREQWVREAAAWVEYCNGPADSQWGSLRARNGHPEPYGVKYWEIDNEAWPVGVESYIQIVRDFALALRAVDPSIKILVCGSADYDDRPGHSDGWNRDLIAACAPLFDFLSIHHYEPPVTWDTGGPMYEAFLARTADQLRQSANPNARIYVSEWNLMPSIDHRGGLYAGMMLNGFERQGEYVAMAAPALFLRHLEAGDWNNAFINFDQTGWFAAPNYVVMKLWRDHYAPLRVALEGDAGPLNAVATAEEGEQGAVIWKAVNPGAAPVAVELRVEGAQPRKPRLWVVAPGDLMAQNSLADTNRVAPMSQPVEITAGVVRLTLPPLSAAVLRLER